MSATNANIFEAARCLDKWGLFDSTNPRLHAIAKRECYRCPVLEPCQRRRDEMLSATAGTWAEGTWAGELLGYKGAQDVA